MNRNNYDKSKIKLSKIENVNAKRLQELDLSDFIGKLDISSEKSNPNCESNLNDSIMNGLEATFHSNQNLENNSNRSLFKISEESLINNRVDSNNIELKRLESKSASVSNKKIFKKNSKNIKCGSADEIINRVSNYDDQSNEKTKNPNHYYYSPEPANKFKKTYNINRKNKFKLRRAQSEISFILFENLVKKTKLTQISHISHKSKGSLELKSTNQFDNKYSSNAKKSDTFDVFSKKEENSLSFENKASCYLKSSFSSLLDNGYHVRKSASLRCTKLVKSKSFQNLPECFENLFSISLYDTFSFSQFLQYNSLKQFKNTLECIELLGSISLKENQDHIAFKKSDKINIPNSTTQNDEINDYQIKCYKVDKIRKNLLSSKSSRDETEKVYHNSNNANMELKIKNIDEIEDNKSEYEKQGAIPKSSKFAKGNFDDEYLDIGIEKRKLNRHRPGGRKKSNGNMTQSLALKPDYISNLKLKEQIYDDINLNFIYQNDSETNHYQSKTTDLLQNRKKNSQHRSYTDSNQLPKTILSISDQRQNHNLTKPTTASVKIFRRDFLDRFNLSKNREIYSINDKDPEKFNDLIKQENHYEKINFEDYYDDGNIGDIETELIEEKIQLEDINNEVNDFESEFKNRRYKSKDLLSKTNAAENALEQSEKLFDTELKSSKSIRFNDEFLKSKLNKNSGTCDELIFDGSHSQDLKPFLNLTEDEEDNDFFNSVFKKTSLSKIKNNNEKSSNNEIILKNNNRAKKNRSNQLTYENFMEIIKLNDNNDSESNDDIIKNEYIYDDIIDDELMKDNETLSLSKRKVNEKKRTSQNFSHYRYNLNINHSNFGATTSNHRLNSNFSNENSYCNNRSRSLSSGNRRNNSISLNFPEDLANTNSRVTRQFVNKKLRIQNRFRNNNNDRSKYFNPNNFDSTLNRNIGNQLDRNFSNNEYLYIDNSNLSPNNNIENKLYQDEEIKKKIFHWKISKFFKIKIPFDHFSLLAMFDKNKNYSELICTIIISFLVAVFASLILSEKLYDDILAIVFCFIVASCHYSLIKSVQPDSSSPIHGFNSLTAFSRPIYFCLICSIILFLRFLTIRDEDVDSVLINQNKFSLFKSYIAISNNINDILKKFSLYGYILNRSHFELLLCCFEILLLFFPLIFTFGLFPQITTFFLCILEQIDMYIFGGTAMNSLLGAILSLIRSILFTLILSSILFSSIYSIQAVSNHQNYDIANNDNTNNSPASVAASNNQFSQSVIFSVYCGLLVIISYFLSRQSSNIQAFISTIKNFNIFIKRNKPKISEIDEKNLKQKISINSTDSLNNDKKNMDSIPKKSSIDTRKRNKSNSSSKDNDRVDDLNSLINLKDKKNIDTYQLKKISIDDESNKLLRSNDDSSSRSSISPSSSSFLSLPSDQFKPFTSNNHKKNDKSHFSIDNNESINNAIKEKYNHQINESLQKKNECLKNPTSKLKNFESSSINNSTNNNEKIKKTDGNSAYENLKNIMGAGANLDENEVNLIQDPFETKNQSVIKSRLESDLFVCLFTFIFVFAIHVSTVFNALKPVLNDILFFLAIVFGMINHYIIPHLRLENPWYFFNQPLLKPKHWSVFEPNYLAKMEYFEVIHVGLTFFEKNVLNVLVILSSITLSSDAILLKYESIDPKGFLSCLIITVISMKLLRNSYCNPAKQYQIFFIAYLFNKFDSKSFNILHHNDLNISSNKNASETILFDLFLISFLLNKLDDLLHKLQFIYVYTAPWQLPWGSAFHAFAQPLSAPHTSLLLLQAFLSSLINSPLMPFMGSAIFVLSYVRPIKFWEKNYKTKRVDNSNTRLQSQLDATSSDSENLNAIFYEHLTSVLQNSLCGDIMMGRWGNVQCGDFYVLSSDYLNCLVHIIEMGNGFITFQLRGLEFKGTYCQQRELEAITEDNTDNENICCCKIGHLKYMLSFNAAFHLRWVAWSVVARKYIVNAYRIVDNDLSLIVNFFSLRRTLIDFYIKSTIFYFINSTKLNEWLNNPNISEMIKKLNSDYIDYDTCFDSNLDMDFDTQLKGVPLSKFSKIYSKWINHCKTQRLKFLTKMNSENSNIAFLKDDSPYSAIVKFCFSLSLVCRRALVTACTGLANNNDNLFHSKNFINDGIPISMATGTATSSNLFESNTATATGSNYLNNSLTSVGGNGLCLQSSHIDTDSLASFQHGYYTLFKGDIRIQSPKDEWVFNDMDILKRTIIPGVRMGLRLHQDHFQNDTNDEINLYENLTKFETDSVISYEKDPIWRFAVLNSIQSLLSLRHQFTEYSDQYKVVMLNKSFLSFRVIKINKECVRSFWAGQQHELIFLRNKNQERGSIQNAKQVLRNIINSSCDQPIGYPIYVSPLTTSYSSTHNQINRILGEEFTIKGIYNMFLKCFRRF